MKSIFVSSTFKDMQYERDAIHEYVAPKLNAMARLYGDYVSFCDLRWGVNTMDLDDVEGGTKVINICLDEIERCRPYMVVIVGYRYGWIPPARLVSNAIEGRDLYLEDLETSVTALEVEYGALRNREQLSQTLFYFREIEGCPSFEYGVESEKHRKKLNELKRRIIHATRGQVKTYRARWDTQTGTLKGMRQFANMLYMDVLELLKAQWELSNNLSPDKRERSIHISLANQNAYPHSAREDLIDDYLGFVRGQTELLAIRGASGCGKTALLSRLYQRLCDCGDMVVPVFCGATLASNDALDIIKIIVHEIESLLGIDHYIELNLSLNTQPGSKAITIDDWRERMELLVQDYNERNARRIYFIIDAIDQLFPDESRSSLAFIPSHPGDAVHIVISCSDTYVLARPMKTCDVPPLDEHDVVGMIQGIMESENREIDHAVLMEILHKRCVTNPQYLRLVVMRLLMMSRNDFEEISAGGGDMSAISARQRDIVRSFPDDVIDAFSCLITAASERIGENTAWLAMAYIAASRHGLRDTDLSALFSLRGIEWNGLTFSMFVTYLQDFFIVRDDGRFDFSHKDIRAAMLAACCSDMPDINRLLLAHFTLLDKDDYVRIHEIGFQCIKARNVEFLLDYVFQHAGNNTLLVPFALDCREAIRQDRDKWFIGVLDHIESDEMAKRVAQFVNNVLSESFSSTKEDAELKRGVLVATINMLNRTQGGIECLEIADTKAGLGDTFSVLAGPSDFSAARSCFDAAIKYYESDVENFPSYRSVSKLAQLYIKLADNYIETGCNVAAYETSKKAVELCDSWEGTSHQCSQEQYACCLVVAGKSLFWMATNNKGFIGASNGDGKPEKYIDMAQWHFEKAARILQDLYSRDRRDYRACVNLAETMLWLSDTLTVSVKVSLSKRSALAEIFRSVRGQEISDQSRIKAFSSAEKTLELLDSISSTWDQTVIEMYSKAFSHHVSAILDLKMFSRLEDALHYAQKLLNNSRHLANWRQTLKAYRELSIALFYVSFLLLCIGDDESLKEVECLSNENLAINIQLQGEGGSGAEMCMLRAQFIKLALSFACGEVGISSLVRSPSRIAKKAVFLDRRTAKSILYSDYMTLMAAWAWSGRT